MQKNLHKETCHVNNTYVHKFTEKLVTKLVIKLVFRS